MALFQFRHGQLLGKERFRLLDSAPPEEVMPSFLLQFYAGVQTRPRTVFVRLPEAAAQVLQNALDQALSAPAEAAPHGRRPARLEVRVPQRGKHVRFLRMAEHNALVEWESGEKKRAGRDARFQVLDELRDALQLDAVPRRIEAFDISHLEGSDAVASLVVFVDGRPEKQSYRHFRLRSLDGKVDDYAAMREVVARRYTRAVNDNRALPDLVLVDGGKGQVSAASKVLRALELGSVPVAGLAKRNEEVFVPGRSTPVALPDGSAALRLLQAARDESHRFANSFNRRLRGKRVSVSMLEAVHGIGRVRSRRLLEAFGSVSAMLAAPPETIAARAGVTRETAATLLAHLGQQYGTGGAAAAVPSTPD